MSKEFSINGNGHIVDAQPGRSELAFDTHQLAGLLEHMAERASKSLVEPFVRLDMQPEDARRLAAILKSIPRVSGL
jgi:hypothetical protein